MLQLIIDKSEKPQKKGGKNKNLGKISRRKMVDENCNGSKKIQSDCCALEKFKYEEPRYQPAFRLADQQQLQYGFTQIQECNIIIRSLILALWLKG